MLQGVLMVQGRAILPWKVIHILRPIWWANWCKLYTTTCRRCVISEPEELSQFLHLESQLITNDLLMAALDKAKVTNPFISCNLSILSYTLFTFVIYCFYVYGYWEGVLSRNPKSCPNFFIWETLNGISRLKLFLIIAFC
jgi:hypothetical protein